MTSRDGKIKFDIYYLLKFFMEIRQKEEFIICPCCNEEDFITLTWGFNIVSCPHCEYYLIVYLDETGKAWTREPGVLTTGSDG